MSLKITNLRSQSHPPWASELSTLDINTNARISNTEPHVALNSKHNLYTGHANEPRSRAIFHRHNHQPRLLWSIKTIIANPHTWKNITMTHNEWDGVSNHRRPDCLLNRLLRRTSKKTSKLLVIGLWQVDDRCIPLTKGPVTRKMFPFDDVIMDHACYGQLGPSSPIPIPGKTVFILKQSPGSGRVTMVIITKIYRIMHELP